LQRRVVCRREELEPGTMRAFKVGGPRIAVACLENSSYRAIHDTCPHEMASLARGKVEKMWVSDEVGHYRDRSDAWSSAPGTTSSST
jgi:nitrite reductase/ring-hydroxylating ferredoxin subunit